MDEQQFPPEERLVTVDELPQTTVDDQSPFERFADAFVAPTEAFGGLCHSPKRASVVIFGMIIGIIVNLATLVLLTQSPEIVDQLKQRQLASAVKLRDEGKISNEDFHKIESRFDEAAGKTFSWQAMLGIIVVSPITWALATVLVFVLGRALGSAYEEGISYLTSLSVYMVAFMIPLLEKLLQSVAQFLTRNINFKFSPSVLVHTDNYIFKAALDLINPFTIWWIFVLATGIALVSGTTRSRVMLFWWGVYAFLAIAYGWLNQLSGGMFG
jgi:hypothetical protein